MVRPTLSDWVQQLKRQLNLAKLNNAFGIHVGVILHCVDTVGSEQCGFTSCS